MNNKLNESFEYLMALMPGSAYVKNKDSYYLDCSDSYSKLAGLSSRNMIVGKTDHDLPWQAHANTIRRTDFEAVNLKTNLVVEETLTLKDGSTMTFLTSKSLLIDQHGKFIGVLGILSNITTRKDSEKKLKATHDHATAALENILNNIPAHIFWKDRNCILLGCNDLQAIHMGFNSGKDLIGKSNYDVIWTGQSEKARREQADAITKIDLDVINRGITHTVEEPLVLPDGTTAIYLSTKTPLRKSNGGIIGILGIALDITERKKLEEDLVKAKEQAEAADKLKTDFIHNMEHDIRTPFNGIYSLASLMEAEETDPEKKVLLGSITQCAKELLDYCNNILDFSKTEAGAFPLLAKKFDLKLLLHKIAMMEIPEAKVQNLELLQEIADDMPATVIGDPSRIERIMLNLLGNSFKFTQKGHIKISAKVVKQKDDKNIIVRLAVEDTGIGIPKEVQEHVYEKFIRGTPANQGIYKGSGLGLRVVKQLIEELEGEIDVESEVGKGTTFICTIPFKLPLIGDVSLNRPVKLLLVEPDLELQSSEITLLQDLGCLVDAAVTGKQALDHFSKKHYDLIFTALTLPDMKGAALITALRNADNKDRKTPIIALAAYKEKDEENNVKQAGANEFIAKPPRSEQCEKLLSKYISISS